MSIFSRIGDILSANINALIDKAENPEKMIDEYLRQAVEDLNEVKKETAGIMADESRAKRMYEENLNEKERFTSLAKKALTAGNEGDAKVFIAKKQEVEKLSQTLKLAYETAQQNADKMRTLHDKLVDDINTLHSRRDELKAKISLAKTQEKVNEFNTSSVDSDTALSNIARYEEKIDKMVDTANAKAELNAPVVDTAEQLSEKYEKETKDVNDELEAMKKSLGLDKQ